LAWPDARLEQAVVRLALQLGQWLEAVEDWYYDWTVSESAGTGYDITVVVIGVYLGCLLSTKK